jgi:hypothetical protein
MLFAKQQRLAYDLYQLGLPNQKESQIFVEEFIRREMLECD